MRKTCKLIVQNKTITSFTMVQEDSHGEREMIESTPENFDIQLNKMVSVIKGAVYRAIYDIKNIYSQLRKL